MEAAIDTIAAEGLARASFARIARTAGLSSTGLISYHFAGKQELMDEVVRLVAAEFAAFVEERRDAEAGPAAELRAFIAANVEFASKHRTRLLAALDVARAERKPAFQVDLPGLAGLLRAGQRHGEFRFFDVDVMAIAVQSVLDGVLNRLAADQDADLGAYTEELATLFELATCG
ncbi:MAG: TetR family transcriptional regulator [Actinophytocola sp.]|nr:TetR family transcriptional regulator [Actinophytocola sp.]